MRWTLSKRFTFEAAHLLPQHNGKCRRLHGHSFVLIVECRSTKLQQGGAQVGMVIDYGDISTAVKPLLDTYLDHWYLNESTGLANPTSEELARWVYQHLIDVLPSLTAIVLEETCTSACRYSPLEGT